MSFSHVVLLRLLLQLRLKMVLMTEPLWATDPDNESKSICSKFHHIDTTTTQLNSKQPRQNSGNIENFEKNDNSSSTELKAFYFRLVQGSWPELNTPEGQELPSQKYFGLQSAILFSAVPPLSSASTTQSEVGRRRPNIT